MKSNKTVGLCVCYDQRNFGSQLQVLATLHAVERLGYEYEIIRYRKRLTPIFCLKSLPRLLNWNFVTARINRLKKRRGISKHPEIRKLVEMRTNRFDRFAKDMFKNLSPENYGYAELRNNVVKYYSVLTGSDQLWLPGNLGSHFYTQEFVPDNLNKVAYATSFGVSSIPWYQRKRTGRYLKRFDHLSCREMRGVEIVKELTGINAEAVVDPTLLYDKEGWLSLIGENRLVYRPYIFCYFLGKSEEHRRQVQKLAETEDIAIVAVPFLNNYVECDIWFGDIQLYDIDSSDFVNLIRNAEYIATDSFHGSVFSIIHHKKFIVFNRFSSDDSNSRNSRIDSLMTTLDLQERRYNGDIMHVKDDIDYERVDGIIQKEREKSWQYLEMALKNK